jgi:hypothetical protein
MFSSSPVEKIFEKFENFRKNSKRVFTESEISYVRGDTYTRK